MSNSLSINQLTTSNPIKKSKNTDNRIKTICNAENKVVTQYPVNYPS